jgi:spore coat polysaccharide biosynthesis protein SpsF
VGHPKVRVFIQARMSSARFPGKVLAPLNGRPVIAHVISQIAQEIPVDKITVATSLEESDDPLVYYVQELGVSVYRGALESVFERFKSCLEANPCTWFFRICADSPFFCSRVLRDMLAYADRSDIDLVTNVQVRTFPKGHSAEMINAATFAAIDPNQLSAEEKEHLTKIYYNNPTRFSIINIESSDPEASQKSFVVDTLEDLRRLETGRAMTECVT